MESLSRFYSDGTLAIAFWRNVVLIDLAGNMTKERMVQVGNAYRALLVDQPAGVVGFATIRPGVPVSSSEARAEGARFIKDLGQSLLALIMVVEDGGVFAQIMRTVIRGINVVTRNSKMVAFATVEDAIQSTARLVSNPENAGDLPRALRSAIRTHRATLGGDSPPLRHVL